jgi:Fe-S-cluster-containing dehydrogenase component/CRP-like cAMP-binding protein
MLTGSELTIPLTHIDRPQRWSEPFGDGLTPEQVASLLGREPFSQMDPAAFPASLPLAGILANDCRLVEYQPGDVVFRQGDYGNSAFLLLAGRLQVVMGAPECDDAADAGQPAEGWLARLQELIGLAQRPDEAGFGPDGKWSVRESATGPRMFVQDVPAVLARGERQVLEAGQIFGELSAINRAPRSVSVIAGEAATVLELRWQGLRDLMQRDLALRKHIDQLYRERGLDVHLSATPLLRGFPPETIHQIAEFVEFESHGTMQWTQNWRSTAQSDIAERILAEPLIARQGDYCECLLLIRNGFARVTRLHGKGEQTIEYLGRGGVFGLRELVHNCRTGEQRPWQLSLRATGYTDILRIPAGVFESTILPGLDPARLPPPLPSSPNQPAAGTGTRRLAGRKSGLETSLLETIVQQRLMNGTEAMVIDLNRCTRCDDCVRACAATHEGTPRFLRQGLTHGQWMFAQACMHCADPVCMIGCPTGAIARDGESGLITINDRTCIGCGTCASSCPYSNIQMTPLTDRAGKPVLARETGLPVLKAAKCDLCLEGRGGPACQRACPHDALIRIDLTSPGPLQEWISG